MSELNLTNSSNEKIKILSEHQGDETLEDLLDLIYGDHVYNISGAGLEKFRSDVEVDLKADFRKVASKLREFEFGIVNLKGVTSLEFDLLKQFLGGSFAMGVAKKTIETAFGRKVFDFHPYMRCSGFERFGNIRFPAFAQEKVDGVYINVVVGKEVEFITRNGKKLVNATLKDRFDFNIKDVVLTGEMLVIRDGKPLERKEGNGLINSLLKAPTTRANREEKIKESKKPEKLILELERLELEWSKIASSIQIVVWDMITLEEWKKGTSKTLYRKRLMDLHQLVDRSNLIKPIDTFEVHDQSEIDSLLNEMYAQGKEGLVVKNKEMLWKDGTSTEQIKLKEIKQCELKVVDWIPGKGQFQFGIGALLCESCDGLLEVNVSGLTVEERGLTYVDPRNFTRGYRRIDGFDPNIYIGKIITVDFNALIEDESKASLFLPRFVEIREDKFKADSLDTIRRM
jgi:ATP-dependent DNA ligase